jgi:uridine kinase
MVPMLINELQDLLPEVLAQRSRLRPNMSLLLAVSGIDASGKGYVAAQISELLQLNGLNAVAIGIDPWLGDPRQWSGKKDAGELFYRHGIRFDDLFRALVLPLKQHRSIHLPASLRRQVDSALYSYLYDYRDVDVIVLEGIFLLKRTLRSHYDLSLWVECSFQTSLERALQRNQEGLPPALIAHDYHSIYHPAQRIHLAVDHPRGSADEIFVNDPRLQGIALGLGYEGGLDAVRRSVSAGTGFGKIKPVAAD